MPAPFAVELAPHDSAWAARAREAAAALRAVLGPVLHDIHHIGSTAVPGLVAKPIVDLLAVVTTLGQLDGKRGAVEALGYRWWGEYGLAGRRYATRDAASDGRRLLQLHCFAAGSSAIARHLALPDRLRADPALAQAYAVEKQRCRALHPEDTHAYSACKAAWLGAAEAEALARIAHGRDDRGA